MNPVAAQQVALNNALIAPEKRLKIKKCNARIEFSKPQREETYQVTLDALKLSPCYLVFLITAEICPRLHNKEFVEPPSEEEMVSFIQELGYSSKCEMLSVIHIDHMYKPWSILAAINNKCISGKSLGLDRLRLSRAQILWGMYNKKNVDFVALLWEDFMFQADNKEISSTSSSNAALESKSMPLPLSTLVGAFFFNTDTPGVSLMTTHDVGTVVDFLANFLAHKGFSTCSSSKIKDNFFESEATFLNFLAFLGVAFLVPKSR
nr:hypothetical protein [Tanacetum cinerariifolium]